MAWVGTDPWVGADAWGEHAAAGSTRTAELSGAGTLAATSAVAATATAALSGAGTLTASTTVATTRTAALSGDGTLTSGAPRPNIATDPTGDGNPPMVAYVSAVTITPNIAVTAPDGTTTATRLSVSGSVSNPGLRLADATVGKAYTLRLDAYYESGPSTFGFALAGQIAGPDYTLPVGQWTRYTWTTPAVTSATAHPGFRYRGSNQSPLSILVTNVSVVEVGDDSPKVAATASVPLSGAGTLTAAVSVAATASVPLSGAGTLTAQATGAAAVTAPLSGEGALTATSIVNGTRTAELSGAGTLSVITHESRTVQLGGAGTLTATVTVAAAVTLELSGDGALTASTTVAVDVDAPLSGTGELAVDTFAAVTATVELSGDGALTAVVVPPLVDVVIAVGRPSADALLIRVMRDRRAVRGPLARTLIVTGPWLEAPAGAAAPAPTYPSTETYPAGSVSA